ncbi:MAG TPA: SDR family oxidoreductase, partial [Bryobacteraceae bacterium]|nr:SDR family oxidoreductase [Bryobacteraceae bacterium]
MDLQLNGKLALVSASTAGIGLAIAESLAGEGADVIVNGRTKERVAAAGKQVRSSARGKVHELAADLATAEGVAEAIARYPEVDILVNNLGIYDPKPFVEIPDEDWMRMFEINVMSGVRLSRHYFPLMRAKNWGRIVFISSESALQIPAEMIHYGMTKAAQLAIARGLAETTKGTGVTVNSVLPGPTMSEGLDEFVTSVVRDATITREQFEEHFFKH